MKEIYKETTIIPKEDMEFIKSMLSIKQEKYRECDEGMTVYSSTTRFLDGFEADINLCDDNPPWVNPVLFNEHGAEVSCLDAGDEFLGEFVFETDDALYILIIEEE